MLVSDVGVLPGGTLMPGTRADSRASTRGPGAAVGFQRPVGLPGRRRTWTCTGPWSYIGHERVRADLDRLQAATRGTQAEPFLTAVAPRTIEHWLSSDHYADDESFLMTNAETMRVGTKPLPTPG